MRELGKALQARRESLGLDLADVERTTKIRRRYLHALEIGDWSILPGEVYARGFVRAYAEFLGLDGLKLLEQYVDEPKVMQQHLRGAADEASQSAGNRNLHASVQGPSSKSERQGSEPETDVSSESVDNSDEQAGSTHQAAETSENPEHVRAEKRGPKEPEQQTSNLHHADVPYTPPRAPKVPSTRTYNGNFKSSTRRSARTRHAIGQGAAVVAAFAILVGAWWVISGHTHTNASGDGSSPMAANINTGNEINGSTDNSSGDSTNASSTNLASSTNNTSVGNAETGNGAASNSTSSGTASDATVQTSPYDAKTSTVHVVVTTSQPLTLEGQATGGSCWVEVMADGKTIDGNDFIKPGKPKTWTGSSEIRIKLGNAPVVSIKVNGQSIAIPSSVQKPIWIDVKKHS